MASIQQQRPILPPLHSLGLPLHNNDMCRPTLPSIHEIYDLSYQHQSIPIISNHTRRPSLSLSVSTSSSSPSPRTPSPTLLPHPSQPFSNLHHYPSPSPSPPPHISFPGRYVRCPLESADVVILIPPPTNTHNHNRNGHGNGQPLFLVGDAIKQLHQRPIAKGARLHPYQRVVGNKRRNSTYSNELGLTL